jgi:hypothetical protein
LHEIGNKSELSFDFWVFNTFVVNPNRRRTPKFDLIITCFFHIYCWLISKLWIRDAIRHKQLKHRVFIACTNTMFWLSYLRPIIWPAIIGLDHLFFFGQIICLVFKNKVLVNIVYALLFNLIIFFKKINILAKWSLLY